MTTEEKAKAYDEALKDMRVIYPKLRGDAKLAAEHAFPELRESEDERIRRSLVDYFGHYNPKDKWDDEFLFKDVISYLEKQKESEDKGEVSDGYHTFNELYYYRMLYNAAFFNLLPKEWVHKSKRHHDGEECFGGGWFIVMANLTTGQISNHYELKDWNLFQIPEKEIADEWDGHTPQEAAERLHKYLQGKYGVEQKPLPEDTVLFNKGVEEGKRLMMDEWLKDRDGCFWDGVEEGKKAMKEQMMKEAVEGEVLDLGINYLDLSLFDAEKIGVKEGDKVRIIIVKEDGK